MRIIAFIVLDLHLTIKQSYAYHLLMYAVALNTEMGEKEINVSVWRSGVSVPQCHHRHVTENSVSVCGNKEW